LQTSCYNYLKYTPSVFLHYKTDATTAEKLRGTKVWVPTLGRLHPAPGQRLGWVLGAGGGRPPHAVWAHGYYPCKNLNTPMLNPAFW